MKSSILICLLFSVIFAIGCGSQTMSKENANSILIQKSSSIIDTFFTTLKRGYYKNALYKLLRNNDNIDLKDSSTLNLEYKFNEINESSGEFISENLLRKKELGNDLGVYVYFVNYSKKFYRFTFYNNDDKVKIYKFSFDDTLDSELEESMRLHTD